jgi:phage terminase Nu1 subunit (DNA packaging protein)
MPLMGCRQYARHRGVSLATVQRKISRGIIPTTKVGNRGRIPSEVADQIWYHRSQIGLAPGINGATDVSPYREVYLKARADLMELKAQHAEIKLRVAKGELIPAVKVKSHVVECARNCRGKLIALPDTLGPTLVATEPPLRADVLKKEISNILDELEVSLGQL